MTIIFNPGTEAVPEATSEQATINIEQFIADLNETGWRYVRLPDKDHDGRFGFLLWNERPYHPVCHTVDMPGCSLGQASAGRPWYSPRLYVDGSSWLWGIALRMCWLTDPDKE